MIPQRKCYDQVADLGAWRRGGATLSLRTDLGEDGFTVDALSGSNDYVVRIWHSRSNSVAITM